MDKFKVLVSLACFSVLSIAAYGDKTATQNWTTNQINKALTQRAIEEYTGAASNSIVGKISNTRVTIDVSGTKFSLLDGEERIWECDPVGISGQMQQMINHENTRFSNEVLAVGLNIDTNTVAQINAILEASGAEPIGTATTVGGLLMALAAAIAWLKKNKADKNDLSGKLESSSAASVFATTTAYAVGDYVTYEGKLYKCTTVHPAGEWDAAHFTVDTLMDDDASLVIDDATGNLKVIDATGAPLWTSDSARKYDLVTTTSATPALDSVQFIEVLANTEAGTPTTAITVPTASNGKVADFVIDAHSTPGGSINITNYSSITCFTADGVSLKTDVLTLAANEVARITFSEMAYRPEGKPTYNVAKMVLAQHSEG